MIQTTVVGSYPVPGWLRISNSRESLRDAMLVVLKTQELAGIDLVADGELYRWDINHPETNGMIDYFVRPLQGVQVELTLDQLRAWKQKTGMAYRSQPAGIVTGPLGHGRLNLARDYALYRDLTPKPKKFTVTSPYMLAKVLDDAHYGSLGALVMALADLLKAQLAEIDAAVVQVDEANLPGTPADGPLAAEAINHVLSGVRGEKAVHLCFGNYGGQTIQKGFFRELLPFFNALNCDHVVLEFARRGYDELEVFRDLKPSVALGLGVVDIKDNEVESASVIAGRIENAVKILGAERVRWVHPDCGFWMLLRSVADRKMRALVEGRDLYEGSPKS
jgi:5-methyltetrahydropteroyltriglutamate--homocysteine methyltransferase